MGLPAMRVQLRHLHHFARIVEAGSFSRAASTVHIAQPALSQQIAELELNLGVALLHRSARGIRPTPAGDILYREAVSILGRVGQLHELVRADGPEIEGTVSVGVSSTLAARLLGPFFETCRAAFPQVKLRCSTADGTSLKAGLEAHTLHLAWAFEDDYSPVFARRPMFRQACYLIRKEPLPGNPATVSLRELAVLPLVLPTAPNVVRSKLDRTFSEAGVAPHIAAEGDLMSTTLQAVEAGVGGAILPKGNFSDVPGHANLFATRIDPAIELTASVLWLAREALTPAAAAVRDLLIGFVEKQYLASLPLGAQHVAATLPEATANSSLSNHSGRADPLRRMDVAKACIQASQAAA
jgi:LysR family transcriptional regulator, nitrogen assimilation regulatory protein